MEFQKAGKKLDEFFDYFLGKSKKVKKEVKKRTVNGKGSFDIMVLRQKRETILLDLLNLVLEKNKEKSSFNIKDVLNELGKNEEFINKINQINKLDEQISKIES